MQNTLNTTKPDIGSSQIYELEKFGGNVNKFGFNFAVCDGAGELVCLCESEDFKSDQQRLIAAGLEALDQNKRQSSEEASLIYQAGEHKDILALVFRYGRSLLAGLIDLGEKSGSGSIEERQGQDRDLIKSLLGEMLILFKAGFQATSRAEKQIDEISEELAQTYEELVLLHKLSTNMKVTESDSNFLQMACDNLTDIVSVEGIAILLEKSIDDEKKLTIVAGSGMIKINDEMAANLHERLVTELNRGKEALLDSEVDTPFKYNWPDDVKNIIAVPLFGKDKRAANGIDKCSGNIIGLMVAKNRLDKSDFDSIDVKLFNSVANGCAVFVENGRLFQDLKELFIGSLKALTNSIDAKDQYTRGHSERVAFISRWIAELVAEEEALDAEQINKVYLAGLLHDIGKVGINESILRKKGDLTDSEYEQIRKHPSIGAGILSGIKQMHDIVPGVLYHHEHVDGKGYPAGLLGVKMPLISRIIALADSFDAMTSKRTYRDAMSVDEALAQIEKGLGSQFDEKLGRAFLDSDVYRLWDVIQNGFTDIYDTDDFSEYETYVVETLIG